MGYWLEEAVRPLKRYADFRGRSTRTEMIAFWVLLAVASVAMNFAVFRIDFRAAMIASDILALAVICPLLAVMARRLHDHGKSAWWLLLAVPSTCADIWQQYQIVLSSDPFAIPNPLPQAAQIIAGLSGFALLVLLLWKDEEESNRYGPNPRYDDLVPQ